MKTQLRYYFNPVEKCNMCGSSVSSHKILGKRLNQSQGKNPKRKTGISVTIARCSSCGLIYSNPQPIPFDISDHYGVTPESYWKESYFKIEDHYFQKEIQTAKKLLSFEPGMKSLDIGAGIGKAMMALAKEGFDTYGFEPSAQFHQMAVKKMGISPDRIQLGMIEQMEYDPAYFDFISFGAVLEHLYDPHDSIRKAISWLKPRGIIHLEVPSADWLVGKIVNTYYFIRGFDYVGNLSPMHSPYHLYEFTAKSFRQNGELSGYTIAMEEYHVCDTYMPRLVDLFIKPYMKYTQRGMQLAVWLRKN